MRRLLAHAAVAVVGVLATGGFAMAADTKHTLEDLSWLAGDWETANAAERWTDEHWTTPAGGVMLGMSRTVKAGALSEFEYLRIVQKGDDLVYIAQPGGRAPGTEFKMTSLSDGAAGYHRVVFENPEHDFPKRILYVRRSDGTLVATVDAGEGEKAVTYEYRPLRAAKP
ncbi:MAG TPA: DUF6265 family protein [Candidatus Eisenbacteria bacterium]|jgi:hypothetical protein|nr:DUF6265 family protein [Candidatus Eisenbacteria bacterium]